MSDLRSKLIHLAHSDPTVRADVLPLVSGENRTASDDELRASVIRLAHGKETLRAALLPLLADGKTAKGKGKKGLPPAFLKNIKEKGDGKGSDGDGDGKTDEKLPDFLKEKFDKKDDKGKGKKDKKDDKKDDKSESDKDSGKGKKKAAKDIVAALKSHPERELAMGLVRIAHENPQFKGDILPLLREAADFPAGSIGQQKSGPQQQEPDESYMSGEFTQKEYAELRGRAESGNMAAPDKAASEDELRAGLIRLAHTQPELRDDILPLLQG